MRLWNSTLWPERTSRCGRRLFRCLMHIGRTLAEAQELFPVAASENPRFDLAVYGIMLALQGAAMNAAVVQEQGWTAAYASFVEQICRRELEPPYGAF